MSKNQGIPEAFLPSDLKVEASIKTLLDGCRAPETYERYLQRTNWRVRGDYAVIKHHFNAPCDLLDVGAVPPLLGALLSAEGWTNITVADPKIDIFQDACDHCGITGLSFDLLDLNQPGMDRKFSLVSCCEVLEHLTGNILDAIERLSDFVAPEGCLFITTPNLRSISGLRALWHGSGLASKYKQNVRDQYKRSEGGEAFFGHIREYTAQEVITLFTSFGYDHVVSHYQVHPRTATREDRIVQRLERRMVSWRLFGKHLFRKRK